MRGIGNLKAAIAKVSVEDGFLPVVAPASAFPIYRNEYYKDDEGLLFALAAALREEYKAIIDAGLRVQIDDAFLPWTYAPDEGSLTEVPLAGPRSPKITRDGKWYLALREGNGIFQIDPAKAQVRRIAGSGENGYTGDGGPAVAARFGSLGPGD